MTATRPSPSDVLDPAPPPVAESAPMRELVRALAEVAATPTTVLILGPAGSGRARLARHLHARSGRSGPWVEIACDGGAERALAALGPAVGSAAGGTVLLREVGALPAPAQAFLARALADRPADPDRAARLVATALPDLPARAAAGDFRSELFYRLNVFPLSVPPLRERADDLPALAADILGEDLPPGEAPALAPDALAALHARPFPGEVRELAELLRTAARGGANRITARDLFGPAPAEAAPAFPEGLPLDLSRLERLAIEEALRRAGGNRTQAARLLCIGLRTLRNKLRAWREAGEDVPPSPHDRQPVPVPDGPGAEETAAILARSWARRSQGRGA